MIWDFLNYSEEIQMYKSYKEKFEVSENYYLSHPVYTSVKLQGVKDGILCYGKNKESLQLIFWLNICLDKEIFWKLVIRCSNIQKMIPKSL